MEYQANNEKEKIEKKIGNSKNDLHIVKSKKTEIEFK